MLEQLSNLKYFIVESLSNIWRNKIVNLLSIGTITISLFILGIFFLAGLNLSAVIEEWVEKVQVNIYLKSDITQNNFLYLKDRIETSPEVEEYKYISTRDALDDFKDIFSKYETFAEQLGEDVFPASFEIKIKNEFRTPEMIEKFAQRFESINGIEEIHYDRDWIQRLNTIVKLIQLAALVIGGILVLAAISTTSNVIRMTITSRKDEIEIMRLVGASNSFIKGPFFFEGLIQGLLAGGFAVIMLYLLYDVTSNYIKTSAGMFFTFMDLQFLSDIHIVVFLIGGMLVGTLGSLFSLGRFLKV
ncbi:MAG: ABC transporter permease [Acidobacteria bacterium]|nr:ABC transporter permease [Acidobacteriota bacterium]